MEFNASLSALRQFTAALGPLSADATEDFLASFQPFEARRKTVLTRVGEVEQHLYFVTGGVQRAFSMHGDRDATLVFTYPYSFSGVADSLLTRHPSRYFLETLTASTFLRTSYARLTFLMEQHRELEQLIFRATAFALEGVLQRQIELQCFSAEEKFKALLQRSPQVLRLIPHKYLASYLGIDAATFSKLLGRVRI